jgi:hypothetical protein
MKKVHLNNLLMLAVLLLVPACAPVTAGTDIPSTEVQPTIVSTDFPIVSPEATPLSIDDVVAQVAQPEYLAGCRQLTSATFTGDADYRGIIPGKSTLSDVMARFGKPKKEEDTYNAWIYDGFRVTFNSKDVVKDIYVIGGTDYEKYAISLSDILAKYGCPEIISIWDSSDHPTGDYDWTSFVYPGIGVEFTFYTYPVRLNDKAADIIFERKLSLSSYLRGMDWFLTSPDKVKVASWDEVVESATTESNVTPTSTLDEFTFRVTLESKFDPNFVIENMADPKSLIDTNNQNGFFDFDNATITIEPSADIYLSVSCGSDCFAVLMPINEAEAVTGINMQPGYAGCKEALSVSKLKGIGNQPGSYSCLLTNQGKIVEIYISRYEIRGYKGTLEIQYRIWDQEVK